MSGVDESVCGVNSVMSAGVLDMCGVDPVVSGVDESVFGVNSLMSAGVLDLCGVDTVVYGVDEYLCRVSSVMTGGELDVCGYDSVVPDEVGDNLGCDVGVARGSRGDTGWWLDQEWFNLFGQTCADGSLRPEPPPIHAMCLRRMLLAAAC